MIVVEKIDSRHLAGNVLGDPSQRDLVVYLPPSYATSSRRYPTAYLLHGFGNRAVEWTAAPATGAFSPPIDEVLDPAITKHRAAEMIVVMPDGWTKYGGGMWIDSPVNGNFEQYLTHEVVPFVDSHFRTIPSRDSRGVFGISAGGFGAWNMGSCHPDLFGAMVVHSANSYFEHTHKPMFYKFYNSVYPQEPSGPLADNFWSQVCYGWAACYTPNVAKPPYYVDLPVEFPSGAVVQPLWDQWLRHDPVVNWSTRADHLRQLRGIWLDVGYNDEYDLQYGHRLLSRGLAGAGIAHHAEEHPGDHANRGNERLQVALGWLSETLDTHG